jgi:hypothetical protein
MHSSTTLGVLDSECSFLIVGAMLLTAVLFMALHREGK